MASLQFTDLEIAMIIGVDEVCEMLDVKIPEMNPVRLHVLKGQLKSSAEVRKAIRDQAKQGSSAAQKQFLDLIEKRIWEKKK